MAALTPQQRRDGVRALFNPRNKTVWDGEICYPSLAELPDQPDHVVVIVPGTAAVD